MATLPNVNITETEGLGVLVAQSDGISAMMLTCSEIAGVLEYGNAYQLFSIEDAAALQIDEDNNPFAYHEVANFYKIAGPGVELWIMPIDSSDATGISPSDAFDPNGNYGPVLIEASGRSIRLLGLSVDPETPSAVANGIEGDMENAIANAQALGDLYAEHSGFSIVINARGFSGTPGDLTDYSTATNDRVSFFMSGDVANSKSASIGLILGTLAILPVQRRASRKRNGSVPVSEATFTDGSLVDTKMNLYAAITAKNFIFLRKYPSQPGYYFSTDSTLSKGDFRTISARRTMDKVKRIAYLVYQDWLDEEIPVNSDGTLDAAAIAALKGDIENNIGELMVGKGELSGFQAIIDPSQNVLSTDTINISLRPTPVGYSSQINLDVAYYNPFLNA